MRLAIAMKKNVMAEYLMANNQMMSRKDFEESLNFIDECDRDKKDMQQQIREKFGPNFEEWVKAWNLACHVVHNGYVEQNYPELDNEKARASYCEEIDDSDGYSRRMVVCRWQNGHVDPNEGGAMEAILPADIMEYNEIKCERDRFRTCVQFMADQWFNEWREAHDKKIKGAKERGII